MKEKLDPYMQPLYDALRDMIPSERLSSILKKEQYKLHHWHLCVVEH